MEALAGTRRIQRAEAELQDAEVALAAFRMHVEVRRLCGLGPSSWLV